MEEEINNNKQRANEYIQICQKLQKTSNLRKPERSKPIKQQPKILNTSNSELLRNDISTSHNAGQGMTYSSFNLNKSKDSLNYTQEIIRSPPDINSRNITFVERNISCPLNLNYNENITKLPTVYSQNTHSEVSNFEKTTKKYLDSLINTVEMDNILKDNLLEISRLKYAGNYRKINHAMLTERNLMRNTGDINYILPILTHRYQKHQKLQLDKSSFIYDISHEYPSRNSCSKFNISLLDSNSKFKPKNYRQSLNQIESKERINYREPVRTAIKSSNRDNISTSPPGYVDKTEESTPLNNIDIKLVKTKGIMGAGYFVHTISNPKLGSINNKSHLGKFREGEIWKLGQTMTQTHREFTQRVNNIKKDKNSTNMESNLQATGKDEGANKGNILSDSIAHTYRQKRSLNDLFNINTTGNPSQTQINYLHLNT